MSVSARKDGADTGEGLRDLKRRRTRAAISDAAMPLFFERGFDRVSVAEVARAAQVAEKTVYNYFPAKAQLVFDEGDDLLIELVHSVRTRPAGESALDGVRDFLTGLPEWAAHRRPVRPTTAFRNLIAGSPRLLDYRRRMFARYEADLAGLLAEEAGCSPGSPEPFVAAVALIAVVRAAFEANSGGAESLQDGAARCLDLLAEGLSHYPPTPRGR